MMSNDISTGGDKLKTMFILKHHKKTLQGSAASQMKPSFQLNCEHTQKFSSDGFLVSALSCNPKKMSAL